MKLCFFCLVWLYLATFLAMAQGGHPTPAGIHQAEQADAQAEKNIPPPISPRTTVDIAKLKSDAEELAALAQSIPSGINQTTKGMLPKDLPEKLKRIEKLAKQLRSEIQN
jgi:hypothetical protein